MEHVQLQLNRLSLGHLLPSVITPENLKDLLLEIESHLPEYLKLLYDPKGEVWKLYQTFTCTIVLNKGSFCNCFNFSVGQHGYFGCFNIFNITVPAMGPDVSTDKLFSMVAWYI